MDIDQKKLDIAIAYISRMADGSNPVNNRPMPEHEILNDPNVIRCMFFVKEILEEVKRNDGYIGRRPRTNRDSSKQEYPLEALKEFRYSGDKSITRLVDQINNLADMTVYQKITYIPITAWLKQNGYLGEEQTEENGKKRTVVTDKGRETGIKSELRRNAKDQEYVYITYGRTAQEFIVSNMDKILSLDAMRKASG